MRKREGEREKKSGKRAGGKRDVLYFHVEFARDRDRKERELFSFILNLEHI